MLKELRDIVKLIAECPDHMQRNAARVLSIELQQYEDWVSLGRPDDRTYDAIKMKRLACRPKDWPSKKSYPEG